jgi:hypothetical protein
MNIDGNTIATEAPSAPHGLKVRGHWWAVCAVGVMSCMYSIGLAHFVTGRSSRAICLTTNCVFNADVVRRSVLIGGKPIESERFGFWLSQEIYEKRHPGARFYWPLFGIPLRCVIEPFYPHPWASVYAATVMVGIFFGLGVGSLMHVAVRCGMKYRTFLMLLPIHLLATSQVVACIPDSFGVSAGLLSLSLAVYVSNLSFPAHLIAQTMLAVLLGGTTLTMAGFPILCVLALCVAAGRFDSVSLILRYRKSTALVCIGLAICLSGLAYYVIRSDPEGHLRSKFRKICRENDITFARMKNPARALYYVAMSSVYPIVGPDPKVVRQHAFKGAHDDEHSIMSFDPWRPSDYSLFNGVAAVAWIILLCLSLRASGREVGTLRVRNLLLIWIIGNSLFHLPWGDEAFLYSPHWSFCLFTCAVIGNIRGVTVISRRMLAVLIFVVCAGQISTWASIFRAASVLAASPTGL